MADAFESWFRDAVDRHFGFLVRDRGFTLLQPASTSSPLEYRSEVLAVIIAYSRGELDVMVQVRAETAVLRPCRSRLFAIERVARQLNPRAYDGAPVLSSHNPPPREIEASLVFHASILRTTLRQVLDGDLTACEALAAG